MILHSSVIIELTGNIAIVSDVNIYSWTNKDKPQLETSTVFHFCHWNSSCSAKGLIFQVINRGSIVLFGDDYKMASLNKLTLKN